MPAECRSTPHASLAELLEEAFRQVRAARCSRLHGSPAALSRHGRDVARSLGAWLQSLDLERGARVALMMPNLPQYMVAIAAVLRAGYAVVNVNPLYTARELEHQLKDSGAEVIIVLENFAATLEEVIDRTPVRHVVLAVHGRPARVSGKASWSTSPCATLARWCRSFDLPLDAGRRVTRFNMALAEGTRLSLRRVGLGARRCRVPAVHRRHDRRLQRRHVASSQCGGEHPPNRSLVQADARHARRQADHHRVRAAAVSHLRADHLLHAGRTTGGDEPADPEPARHPGLHQDAVQLPSQHVPRGEHACSTHWPTMPDFARLDFSGLVVSNGGGMAVQQATAEHWRRSPAARSSKAMACPRPRRSPRRNRFDLTDSPAPSACPSPPPTSRSGTMQGGTWRAASPARSASEDRK